MLAKGELREEYGQFALPRYSNFCEHVFKRGSHGSLGDTELRCCVPGRQPGADQRCHSRFGWGESEEPLHQIGRKGACCTKRCHNQNAERAAKRAFHRQKMKSQRWITVRCKNQSRAHNFVAVSDVETSQLLLKKLVRRRVCDFDSVAPKLELRMKLLKERVQKKHLSVMLQDSGRHAE